MSFFFLFLKGKNEALRWFYHVKCSFIFPFLKEMPLISQDLMSYLRHSLVKSWDQKYPFVCAHINTYTQFMSLVKPQLKMSVLLYDVPYIKPSKMYFSLNSEKQRGGDLCLLTFIFSVSSFLIFNYFNWRIILYNIVMAFAIHQHELDMCLPHPEPPSTFLLTRSLWVVPELWLWVPCFVHQTCTDHSILHK